MKNNLVEYFSPQQEIYLEKIEYHKIDKPSKIEKNYSIECTDTLNVFKENNRITLVIERHLKFNPEDIFDLNVSFGANLFIDETKSGDMDWDNINLVDLFKESGQFATDNLMSRISMLIANITSSFGQQPITTPPVLMIK